jgi:hypothetical protein
VNKQAKNLKKYASPHHPPCRKGNVMGSILIVEKNFQIRGLFGVIGGRYVRARM